MGYLINSCNVSSFVLFCVFLKPRIVSFEKEFLIKLFIQYMKSEPLSSMHATFDY